ncbi:Anthranilate synthase component 1 (plasmid) [Buchnera aphidicola (Eriosoma grossulariae)]|uniref:anthranilate synthase component 1 n=1 Tax=Buchnera aphidicola TaxID=9 RepID=UPI003463C3DA
MDHDQKIADSMFFGGLFSYDCITNFEPIPRMNHNAQCPDFCFYLSEILLKLNHQKKTCVIQANLFTHETIEINRIMQQIKSIQKILKSDLPTIIHDTISNISIQSNKTDEEYIQQIKKMKRLIQSGKIFQIVLSRKFYLPCINSLSAYDQLKKSNPSPYMFFMQDQHFILFGASPESSLKYNNTNRMIEIHPIAGTRARGKNQDNSLNLDLDNKIELEMRTNQKELAEHLMLVDLARNDLSKICSTGTRYVSNLMEVHKYSHVMHLVSKVTGKLKPTLDIFHAYQACMNMGTLTGAPKIKAMQIISQIEQQSRNTYGGAIGYFNGHGDLDTCIIIRAAYVMNQLATIQAGAGIILDSVPQEEVLESKNKAPAVLSAIIDAHSISHDYNTISKEINYTHV